MENIECPEDKVEVLVSIARKQSLTGQIEEGKATLSRAISIAESAITWRAFRDVALADLGEFQKALAIVKRIQLQRDRDYVHYRISAQEAETGRGKNAVEAAEKILIDRRSWFPNIAGKLAAACSVENFKRFFLLSVGHN